MTEIYINGDFKKEENAKISVYDHGLLYGDGVFEGIRAYEGKIFKLKQHIDRLFDSAKSIDLKLSLSKEEVIEAIKKTLRKNNLQNAYIRPIITRGKGDLGLDPNQCDEPNFIIIVQEWDSLYGDLSNKGLEAVTVGIRRNSPAALPPNIKSLNYLNNILGKIEANYKGGDEAIFLDKDGKVSEGSGDNIFLIKDGLIKTPPTVNNLKGITRKTAIKMAREQGIKVKEKDIGITELYTADEVFVTGTAAEIAPIVKIDGRKIGSGEPGQKTKELMEEFKRITGETGTEIYD
ncbi:branched-chain amino acid aminotransferase [archaeon SCG-AAA382B04]|nr:branched-chain amino acid aminotransferase [archaeon SCG-AAA382B04]